MGRIGKPVKVWHGPATVSVEFVPYTTGCFIREGGASGDA